MVYCTECGYKNDDKLDKCIKCGKELPKNYLTSIIPSEKYVFCTNCGQKNIASVTHCVNCKSPLQVLSKPQTWNGTPAPQPNPSATFWEGIHPALRSAIVVSILVIAVQALDDIFPVLAFIASAPFAIVIYFLQGVIAGRMWKGYSGNYKNSQSDYARVGALSAVWTSVVFSSIVTIIILSIQFAFSLGTILALTPIILIGQISDIALNIVFSTLGAWQYGRSGGKGIIFSSVVIIGLGIVSVCCLSVVLIFILVQVGSSLLHGLPFWSH